MALLSIINDIPNSYSNKKMDSDIISSRMMWLLYAPLGFQYVINEGAKQTLLIVHFTGPMKVLLCHQTTEAQLSLRTIQQKRQKLRTVNSAFRGGNRGVSPTKLRLTARE